MNEINTDSKPVFQFQEESNYMVRTSFGHEYIVESSHAKKIMAVLFAGEVDFLTINNSVINKRYIQVIEPTKQKTSKEIEDRVAVDRQEEELKNEKLRLEKHYMEFRCDFLDNRYGEGNWILFPLRSLPDKIVVTANDLREVKLRFNKEFPDLVKRYDEISPLQP
jgi:hypothetical protein